MSTATQDVSKLSKQELIALAQAQQAKIDAANKPRQVSMKVSQKGALSLYGLQRFPVTLYREQWVRVLDMADEIRQFISDNNESLVSK